MEMLKSKGTDLKGKTCLISGSGNVAQYTAEKVLELGGKVLTMSDSDGYVYDPAGIDREKLDYIMELKNLYRGRIREYAEQYPGVKYVEGAKPWGEKADIALPSATQNELNGDHARQLVANGCMAVSEGANMPSTPEAIKVFQDAFSGFGTDFFLVSPVPSNFPTMAQFLSSGMRIPSICSLSFSNGILFSQEALP